MNITAFCHSKAQQNEINKQDATEDFLGSLKRKTDTEAKELSATM